MKVLLDKGHKKERQVITRLSRIGGATSYSQLYFPTFTDTELPEHVSKSGVRR